MLIHWPRVTVGIAGSLAQGDTQPTKTQMGCSIWDWGTSDFWYTPNAYQDDIIGHHPRIVRRDANSSTHMRRNLIYRSPISKTTCWTLVSRTASHSDDCFSEEEKFAQEDGTIGAPPQKREHPELAGASTTVSLDTTRDPYINSCQIRSHLLMNLHHHFKQELKEMLDSS